MARIGIPGRVGPGDDMDWLAQEIERRRTWERELTASLPTVVRSIVAGTVALRADWKLTVGIAIPAAWTEQASCVITVPAGYTQMTFTAIATIGATNSTAGTQYLYARIVDQIDGAGPLYGSTAATSTVPAGWIATAIMPQVYSAPVTAGQVYRFWVESWAGGGWSAAGGNYARIEVQATFSR